MLGCENSRLTAFLSQLMPDDKIPRQASAARESLRQAVVALCAPPQSPDGDDGDDEL